MGINVDDDLWEQARERARANGDSLSAIIRAALTAYAAGPARGAAAAVTDAQGVAWRVYTPASGGVRVEADQKVAVTSLFPGKAGGQGGKVGITAL